MDAPEHTWNSCQVIQEDDQFKNNWPRKCTDAEGAISKCTANKIQNGLKCEDLGLLMKYGVLFIRQQINNLNT